MFNGFNCNMSIHSTNISVHSLGALETLDIKYNSFSGEISFPIDFEMDSSCLSKLSTSTLRSKVSIIETKVK